MQNKSSLPTFWTGGREQLIRQSDNHTWYRVTSNYRLTSLRRTSRPRRPGRSAEDAGKTVIPSRLCIRITSRQLSVYPPTFRTSFFRIQRHKGLSRHAQFFHNYSFPKEASYERGLVNQIGFAIPSENLKYQTSRVNNQIQMTCKIVV